MISTIITAYREPNTIGKAIEKVAIQKIPNNEILVVAPDKETIDSAKTMAKKYKQVKVIKDEGKGKSAALNLVVKEAKGDILILTDGDVFLGGDAIKLLLRPFKNKKVGAVTGNPIPINKNNNKYGLWAHTLTKIADERRKKAILKRKRMFCSGYLFAIRKKLFPKLPEELLSEDGFISHSVYDQGYKIVYSPHSVVYVKFPTNFEDWINQKRRSIGGYNQIKSLLGVQIRSFSQESLGFIDFLKQVSSPKEVYWLGNLFLARLYVWALIYRDINIKHKSREELWIRVESTK